jgi:hypothetical protein
MEISRDGWACRCNPGSVGDPRHVWPEKDAHLFAGTLNTNYGQRAAGCRCRVRWRDFVSNTAPISVFSGSGSIRFMQLENASVFGNGGGAKTGR